jgi:hypothetical protein
MKFKLDENFGTRTVKVFMVRVFLQTVDEILVNNNLWIVEFGRIRIHQSEMNE